MSGKKKVIKKNINLKNRDKRYKLRLYITGTTPNSVRAISNTKDICDTYLKGNYDLEIIDVYQEPTLVMIEQIIALPILMKILPLPVKKLIGDMSNKEKMLKGLDIEIK